VYMWEVGSGGGDDEGNSVAVFLLPWPIVCFRDDVKVVRGG